MNPAVGLRPIYGGGHVLICHLECYPGSLHDSGSFRNCQTELELGPAAQPLFPGTVLRVKGPAPRGYPSVRGFMHDGGSNLGQRVPGIYCERELHQAFSLLGKKGAAAGKPADHDAGQVVLHPPEATGGVDRYQVERLG
jgi:hypothetical protein